MKKIEKHEEVLAYIQTYVNENGYAPTIREICDRCEIKSTATAFNILNELQDQGHIKKANNRRRAVSLKQTAITIPLIGTVAAGEPIFASENYEGYYSIPSEVFHGDDLFMLNVHGSSMINCGIYDGDKIVVQKQSTAENGEIVVALVDDSTTVKRFFKRDGKIILHPENDQMEDFIFDDVTILGKVVGLMRSLS